VRVTSVGMGMMVRTFEKLLLHRCNEKIGKINFFGVLEINQRLEII
jgi:hypothetical protein